MRMIPEHSLNAEDVRGMMLDSMEKHLSLRTEGYRSSTHQTFDLLLKAAAAGSSLEAVCADSCGVVACPIRGKRGGIRALCQGRGVSPRTTLSLTAPPLGWRWSIPGQNQA